MSMSNGSGWSGGDDRALEGNYLKIINDVHSWQDYRQQKGQPSGLENLSGLRLASYNAAVEYFSKRGRKLDFRKPNNKDKRMTRSARKKKYIKDSREDFVPKASEPVADDVELMGLGQFRSDSDDSRPKRRAVDLDFPPTRPPPPPPVKEERGRDSPRPLLIIDDDTDTVDEAIAMGWPENDNDVEITTQNAVGSSPPNGKQEALVPLPDAPPRGDIEEGNFSGVQLLPGSLPPAPPGDDDPDGPDDGGDDNVTTIIPGPPPNGDGPNGPGGGSFDPEFFDYDGNTDVRRNSRWPKLKYKVLVPFETLPLSYQISISNWQWLHPFIYLSTVFWVCLTLSLLYWVGFAIYRAVDPSPTSVVAVCVGVLASIVTLLSLALRRTIIRTIKAEYTFGQCYGYDEKYDKRPESHNLGVLKLPDPLYCDVNVALRVRWKFRPSILFYRFMKPRVVGDLIHYKYDKLFTSLEALAQCTNYRTMPSNTNPPDLLERINKSLASLQAVNFTRFEFINSTGALGNASIVAAAYYKYTEGRRIKRHRFLYPQSKLF